MPFTTTGRANTYATSLTRPHDWRTLIAKRRGSVQMRRVSLSVMAFALALPVAAQAQHIETYAYDVHGRLIDVTRMTGGSSQVTAYVLDKADNRTSRTVSTPSSARMSPRTKEAQAPTLPASREGGQRPETPTVPAADASSGGAL